MLFNSSSSKTICHVVLADLTSCLALVCMNWIKSSYRVSVFVRKHISFSVTEVPCYYLNSAAPQRGLTVISIWFGGCHGTRNNSEVTMIPAVLETAKQTLWSSFWLPDHHLLSYNMVCRMGVLLEGITNLVGIALSLWHHLAANTCSGLVWFGFFHFKKHLFNSASTELRSGLSIYYKSTYHLIYGSSNLFQVFCMCWLVLLICYRMAY